MDMHVHCHVLVARRQDYVGVHESVRNTIPSNIKAQLAQISSAQLRPKVLRLTYATQMLIASPCANN